ncbi:hypothetical protein [Streptomyces sp. NPDC058202]|uniref:hypothetical protein n=1 Tax=Streptomyces sp. NPDC058202 TaxID=3346380 RepID=UPI0036E5E57D
MLATGERITEGRQDTLVWHKPVGGPQEEFQAIACSDTDGIVFPASKRDVPLDLVSAGESWCAACLAIIRNAKK